MKIKVHSSELNRMMKTLTQCIDAKSATLGNIEVIYDNNLLSIRGTNGHCSAVMSTPLLGGDGETFCVDGTMFARVCAMCSGEINIETDGKVCTVKGAGRTRLPIVDAKIPAFEPVTGKEFKIRSEAFTKGYNSVSYAISQDQNRLVLTGVLMESDGDSISMTALDGFKMAVEKIPCESADIKVVIPGSFMKLISSSTSVGESITFRTNGKRIQASTDGMMLNCVLLTGEYPDCKKIVPTDFKTKVLTSASSLMAALKCGTVVNSSNNLVKLDIGREKMTVMSNSEQADYDAEVNCFNDSDELKIAFNHKYLMESIGSFCEEKIIMHFNSPISPCVIRRKDVDGFRLILPVRVAG